MKIISSISTFIIDHSVLFIVGLITCVIALFTLNFALSPPMLLLGIVSLLAFMFFVSRPKAFIYFVIFYMPFAFTINKFFKFFPGGSQYLSVNILGVVFVLGSVVGILVLFLEKAQIFKYKLTVPMLLFLGTIIIGIFLSPLKFYAFRYIFRYGMPAILYLLILEKFDFKEAKGLLKIFLISFIPVVLFLDWMVITQREKMAIYEAFEYSEEGVYRLGMMEGGSGFHPNTVGVILPIFIALSLFFYFESQIKYKWIHILLIINMIFLLFYTYSRMGWICFLAGVFVIGLLRSRKLLIVSLIVGSLILLLAPSITTQITRRFEEKTAIESRFKMYEIAWNLFLEKPVLGHGQGAFQIITGAHLSSYILKQKEYGVGGMDTHNEYLKILAEKGIIGMGIFMFLMYRFLKLSVQIFKLPHPTAKNYGAVLIGVIVISLLSGLPGGGFESTNFYILTFWAIGEILLREFQSPQSA